MTIESLKLEIINKVLSLKDTSQLKKIEATLDEMSSEENIIAKLNIPMRKTLDIEKLKKEQNFKPINKKEFFQKIDELNITEPIGDLLAMI